MAKQPIPLEKIAAYDRLLATHPQIERKGKDLLYTSVNGHMFTVFSSDATLGIRLPEPERSTFLETYETTLLKSYGAVMKEYVAVPDELLDDTDGLAPYLARSYAYVSSLQPKATRKS